MVQCKSLHAALLASLILVVASLAVPAVTRGQRADSPTYFVDSVNGEGVSRTVTTYRAFEFSNPFFQPLGANGRTCGTCHPVSQGMTISPGYIAQVFAATQGLDPLFAPVDGANSPDADMSSVQARQANCSMLLTKGLLRIGLAIPANAEFTLALVDDPYQYASDHELSCFRRPLPATNLRFLAAVMWDGRELSGQSTVMGGLASQARDAVMGHLQAAAPPSDAQIARILDFETHLYTSQIYDNAAGSINTAEIGAGPVALINLPFALGINAAFGGEHNRQQFNQNVFAFYIDWLPRRDGRSRDRDKPKPA